MPLPAEAVREAEVSVRVEKKGKILLMCLWIGKVSVYDKSLSYESE